MRPRPPELRFPRQRRWAVWAVALSAALHALIFLVQVRPWMPPYRLPPSVIVLVPPGSEGSQAVELQRQQPGGAAHRGRAAGITPREEPPAPTPEPARAEEPVAPAPVSVPQPQPAETAAAPPPGAMGPRTYYIGPALGEGKLWVRPLPAPPREIVEAHTKSHIQLVDSAVSAIVQAYIDSMANAPSAPGSALPSWTTQIFGKTFGIDSKYIYLGGLKIPSAILALLPIKSGGVTMEYTQASRLAAIREDLVNAAQRAQTMEDFKRAVRELRAERERQHQLEQNQKKPEKEKKDTVTRIP